MQPRVDYDGDRRPPGRGGCHHSSLARLLAALLIVLLVVFLAAVLTTALPPRLLDPQRQLALIAVLVNSTSLALMGALLLPLALWIDPANNRLRARWNAFRRWALAACLGFLQLIPVQGATGWRFHTTVTGPAPGAGIGDEP